MAIKQSRRVLALASATIAAAIWLTVPNTAEAWIPARLSASAWARSRWGPHSVPRQIHTMAAITAATLTPMAITRRPRPTIRRRPLITGRGAAGTHITAAITRADFTRHDALILASALLQGLRLPP